MNTSKILQFLQQVPAGYPAVAIVNGVAVPVTGFSFSHDPQEVRFELAPLVKADATPAHLAAIEASFTRWWYAEGSELRRREGEDIEEFVARATRIAWMNGAHVERYGPAPLPEPEATIAELNAIKPGETFGEAYVAPTQTEAEAVAAAEAIGTGVKGDDIVSIPAGLPPAPKRTRKGKNAPFGTE